MSDIAVILLRGRIGFHRDVKYTLDLLRLQKKHTLVVLKDTKELRGMLQKVKDAVTWGEIDAETFKLLATREKKDQKDRSYYTLNSPKGGFERKGIKRSFNLGGALGNRKEKINLLIKKML